MEDSVLLPAGYTLGNLLTNELTVPVRDDELLENTESFQVTLRVESGHEGVTVGSPSTMTIFIEDNDGECVHGSASVYASLRVCIFVVQITSKYWPCR